MYLLRLPQEPLRRRRRKKRSPPRWGGRDYALAAHTIIHNINAFTSYRRMFVQFTCIRLLLLHFIIIGIYLNCIFDHCRVSTVRILQALFGAAGVALTSDSIPIIEMITLVDASSPFTISNVAQVASTGASVLRVLSFHSFSPASSNLTSTF